MADIFEAGKGIEMSIIKRVDSSLFLVILVNMWTYPRELSQGKNMML